jgi:DNA-binding MltR family transcriptional regulator
MLKDVTTEIELKAIYDEIDVQTDRGAAIISGAILEEQLTEALKRRLILTASLSEKIFNYEQNGALSAFAQKIDVSFAVGMIKPDVRDDLHNIRRIRNRFAHRIEPIDFRDRKIVGFCSALRLGQDFTNPKARYMISFVSLSTLLIVLRNLDIKIQPIRDQEGMDEQIEEAVNRLIPDEAAG